MARSKNIRADLNFKKELDNIKLERIRKGYDNEMQSDRRLTKAIIRSSKWDNIRDVLIHSPLIKDTDIRGRKPKYFNKKGQSFMDIFVFMALGIFILISFAVVMYFSNSVYTAFRTASLGMDTTYFNMTDINEKTLGNFNSAMSMLRLISYVLLFGMIIMIFLSNYLVKENPIYFVFYMLMTIIGVVVSAIISNAYENIMSDSVLNTYFLSMKEGHFIFMNLPYIVAIIGVFGTIFLLIGIIRDTGQEGGGI